MIDEGPLTVGDAVRLAREVGEALAYLHERGWIHRDVKPENILVENGHAVLTDFGIATPIEAPVTGQPAPSAQITIDSVLDGRLTQFGRVIGTPAYMSPEAWSTVTSIAASMFSPGWCVQRCLPAGCRPAATG
jgi:serine/threonine-protein kinase